MNRLYEKKDNLIKKNPNLTEEQKQEIIAILNRHPSYENKIEWNRNSKLTYEDFLDVLRPLYINDLDFKGLTEGEDYDFLLDKPKEKLYAIYTYNASKIIASNSVEPKLWTKVPNWCGYVEKVDEAHAFGHFDSEHGKMKPGAKWCISMQTTDKSWNDYSKDFYFVFWIRDNESLGDNQKIAISIDRKNGRIATIYNASDTIVSLELPSYIEKIINSTFNNFKEKENQLKTQRLFSEFKQNLETDRYDYAGYLDSSQLRSFVSEDGNGFIINFGEILGDFDCSDLGLTSLKGAPTKVGRDFNCSSNNLISLEGAPQTVRGDFLCYKNQLTSLEGAPQKVRGSFWCSENELTSLEGAPTKVDGIFWCFSNKLTSLKGAPREVGGSFICSYNQLISLEGAPHTVGRDFDCCKNNLSSLEGAPNFVKRNFNCRFNPNLHSLDGIGEVKGEIYKDF